MSGVQQGQTRAHAGIKLPARGSLDAERSLVCADVGSGWRRAPRRRVTVCPGSPPGPAVPPRPSHSARARLSQTVEKGALCAPVFVDGVCGEECVDGGCSERPSAAVPAAAPPAPAGNLLLRPRPAGPPAAQADRGLSAGPGNVYFGRNSNAFTCFLFSQRQKLLQYKGQKKERKKRKRCQSLFGIRGRGRREGREPAAWLSVFLLWHESSQLSTPGVKSIISYVSNHYSLFCHQF